MSTRRAMPCARRSCRTTTADANRRAALGKRAGRRAARCKTLHRPRSLQSHRGRVGAVCRYLTVIVSKCHCRGACFRMQTWVGQLFQPLAWLGGLYTMIQAALTDTLNLAALLKVSP